MTDKIENGRVERDELNRGRALLLRGATVITMDPGIGTFDRADILVRGECIAAIGPDLDPPEDAQVFDVSGQIVIPGLIDAHRHTWEIVLRGIGGDWSLVDYFKLMPTEFGKHFSPEDIYAGNLLASVENLDAGITTFGDWADTAGINEDFADAAISGLEDSGIRGRLQYANLFAPAQEWATSPDVDRVWDRYGSPDGRVSMQMAIDSTRNPAFPELAALRYAKDRGISVVTHAAVFGWDNEAWIGKLYEHGLMGPDYTYIHVVAAPDAFVKMIEDTGGAVTMATCSNCNSGQGFPHVAGLCRRGVPVGLGSDNDMRWRHDMFDVMRTTLTVDRLYQHLRAHRDGHVAPIVDFRSNDVLDLATRGGARALGLQDVVGTLTPGKQADLVVLTPNRRAMPTRFNPVAHAVMQADRDSVRTVLVAGRVVKFEGRLVDHDLDQIGARVEQSRDRLISSIGEERIRQAMIGAASDPDAPPPPTL